MRDKIPAGIVISQTDELNKFWRQYIPSKYIYPKYEPEILDAVFKRQKSILNDKNLTKAEKEEKAPFFVLLDELLRNDQFGQFLSRDLTASPTEDAFRLIVPMHDSAIAVDRDDRIERRIKQLEYSGIT